MEKHVKFKKGEQRKFIESALNNSKTTITKIAPLLKVNPRTLRDWKREKYTMTTHAARLLRKMFNVDYPEDETALIVRRTLSRSKANKIGGDVRYLKYGGFGTQDGRIKGGRKAMQIMREKGIIPKAKEFKRIEKHSLQLAEWVGIVLGDGGITKDQVSITLNSIKDKDYVHYVAKLSQELFGETPSVVDRKNCNATRLLLSGVNLIKILKELELKVGNKVKQQVGVPVWVIDNENYCTACLRGLMDTDGGVFVHRYKVNGKVYSYRKICFSNRSLPLLHFVAEVLKNNGFTPKVIDKVENKKVWLYNSSEVERYLSIIGSHNLRLLG